MWRRVQIHTTVRHPTHRVFPYLADPTSWPRFVPAVVFRRAVDDGPIRVGARWMATDRIGPFRFHFIDELALMEPDRRLVWLSSSPWNSRVEYRLADRRDGTDVRATYEGEIDGFLRYLVGWLPPPVTRLILAQDFRRLDRLLSREERAERQWTRRHGAADGRPRAPREGSPMGMRIRDRGRT